MIVNRISLRNWRNFQAMEVDLRKRQFIVGANASGKSNLLDLFYFLRDIAKSEGGGLQQALKERGGVAKIRCLAARGDPEIVMEVHLANNAGEDPLWRYAFGFHQETRRSRLPYLTHERVWKKGRQLLDRPDQNDRKDPYRLSQTFLEQVTANREFRDVVRFFQSINHRHVVPQLLRFAGPVQGCIVEDAPFGQGLLKRLAEASEKTRQSRLSKIEKVLKVAVPQFQQLRFTRDSVTGRPQLQALYSHWRPKAGWQGEDRFSDGTLRLIGFLWSLLEDGSLLLLEEPELSLNAAIVSQLATIISRTQRNRRRQVLVSTQSEALLTEPGVDGHEVLLLTPTGDGTEVKAAADIEEVRALLESGLTVGEVVMPRTQPVNVQQLSFFG